MEPRIRQLYNPSILASAAERFDIPLDSIRELDGFENYIYSCTSPRGDSVLRIGHELHRTPAMTRGEIHWVDTLAKHGVSVPRVFPSRRGALVEVIPAEDGSCFSAVLLEKAPGRSPRREDWNAGLLRQVGSLLGKMHRIAQAYQPPSPAERRPDWHADMANFARKFLPPGNEGVIQKHEELMAHLATLPVDSTGYGLIHQDVHGGNFFVADGGITLFDFDDCLYAWFMHDVAMTLFYVLPMDCSAPEDVEFARRCFGELMDGYARENHLDRAWYVEVPNFLKWREIDLYIAIHRSLDVENLDPWTAKFMTNRKHKIESGLPYVALDFALL